MNYPPPTYLTGTVSSVSQNILSEIRKDYGGQTTAFKFNTNFNKGIRTWNKEFQHPGGTIWGLDTTGIMILLFDPFRHGYNAMMNLNEEEDLDSTNLIDFPTSTEIIIAFQYSGEEDQYVKDGASAFKQDYFDWVVIYKLVDGKLEKIFEYECA